jgi:hypothetical protein
VNDAQPERLVVFYGNCHAHYLAGIFAAQGVGLVCIVGAPFGFVAESRGLRSAYIDAAAVTDVVACARAVGQKVVFVEQSSPVHEGMPVEETRLADVLIRFPHVETQAYWPHLSTAEGRFSIDRIRRRWDFDIAALRRSEAKAGWNSSLSDFIEQTHQSALLFNTFNHPAAGVMSRLHRRISDELEQAGPMDATLTTRASADIDAERGISFMLDHPLARTVVEALKLKWAESDWYEAWISSVEAGGQADFARSKKQIEAALASPDCDAHAYYTYGLVLTAIGDHKAAHQAFGRVHRAYPLNNEYARKWISGLRPHDFAEPHPLAQDILSRYPG